MVISMKNFQKIIKKLQATNQTLATMESCTGGYIASAITDIEGASQVFSFGAVTYNNAYKIKMGVSEETIMAYTVYSRQTAEAMSRAISQFTSADYGVGITGKLNAPDHFNPTDSDQRVDISVYDKNNNCYICDTLQITTHDRIKAKQQILNRVVTLLEDTLWKN